MTEQVQPVYVDMMKGHRLPDRGWGYLLSGKGTEASLVVCGLSLHEGQILYVWTDDADDQMRSDPLVAKGIVRFHTEDGVWVLQLTEHTGNVSDFAHTPDHWTRSVNWDHVDAEWVKALHRRP